MRGKRYILCVLFAASVFAALVDQRHSIAAQANAIPLTIGRTVSGSLSGQGQTRAYIFTVPDNQDVIVWFRADKNIVPLDCQVQINRTSQPPANIAQDSDQCTKFAGGGGDGPSNDFFLFPAQTDPNLRTVVVIRLLRLNSAPSNYKLTTYTTSAKLLDRAAPVSDTLTAAQPFREYAFENSFIDPFVIEAEENKPDAAFLWVANVYTGQDKKALQLNNPQDGASTSQTTGLVDIVLFYLGETHFRLVVHAIGDYTLNYADLSLHTLNSDPSVTFSDSVSYLKPYSIAVLNATAGETLTLSGVGPDTNLYDVFIDVYQNSTYLTDIALGQAGQPSTSKSITIAQSGAIYLVASGPNPTPRLSLSFALTVTRGQGTATP